MRTVPFILTFLVACSDKAGDTASTPEPSDDSGEHGDTGDIDSDNDGYTPAEGDCDDSDPLIHPEADENWYDGIDSDCDGASDFDADGDGYDSNAYDGTDCDDNDSSVNPDASEIFDDGVDQDCDGRADASNSTCTAQFTIDFPDGSQVEIDGCEAWQQSHAFVYPSDTPPELRQTVLSFNGNTDADMSCGLVISQQGICGTGSYMMNGTTGQTDFVTLNCTGTTKAYQNTYSASNGYLRFEAIDTGEAALDPSMPVESTLSGSISVLEPTGLMLKGDFSISALEMGQETDTNECLSVEVDGGWLVAQAGGYHSCALDSDSQVSCWGRDDDGEVSEVPDGSFVDIQSGFYHSCALDEDGLTTCWGYSGYNLIAHTPTDPLIALSTGYYHNCGIDTAGALRCWGKDNEGVVSAPPEGVFTAVSSGRDHSCAIDSDQALHCWGEDSYDQLSDMPTSGTFLTVSAGRYHTCALDTGLEIHCWGKDDDDQVSDQPAGQHRAVEAGRYHSCAIEMDGKLICWGNDEDEQITDTPDGTFVALSAGRDHNCALDAFGVIYCWGDDGYSQSSDAP